MKKFEAPEMEVKEFQAMDVITASGDTFDGDNTGEW